MIGYLTLLNISKFYKFFCWLITNTSTCKKEDNSISKENNSMTIDYNDERWNIEKILLKYYNNCGGEHEWKKIDIKIFN